MRRATEASPIAHVSSDDPPFLLIHGDADETVPFQQGELMTEALREAGVEVKLLRIPGGGHGPKFNGAGFSGGELKDPPDYISEMIQWFNRFLIEPS